MADNVGTAQIFAGSYQVAGSYETSIGHINPLVFPDVHYDYIKVFIVMPSGEIVILVHDITPPQPAR